MNEYRFLIDVAAALMAALAGGLLARLVRIPVLVGYLIAGIVVGPHTPGFIAGDDAVQAVAKLGVALLMFAVGVQFSLKEMLAVRATAIFGGGIQILGTILLGYLVGRSLGWAAYPSIFLGCALSLSSTAVMMRILEERGELDSGHGMVMLGILIVQDLAVVVMAVVLPALAQAGEGGMGLITAVGLSLGRAALSVAVALFLALRGVPVLLDLVARTNVRELFILTIVCFCLSAAYLAHVAGLSLEIGAFLAGLAISDTRYSPEVLAQVRPLRDLFASLFFVSVGMLLNPAFVLANWLTIVVVVAAIIVGKALITTAAVFAFGWHGRTALFTGLGLAQIGEFSFVLATIGMRRDLLSGEVTGVIFSAAMLTLLTAPFVYKSARPLYAMMNAVPALSRILNRHNRGDANLETEEQEAARVLVLGSGRVGKHVSDALQAQGVPHIVVDYNAKSVAHRRKRGISVLYGDATSEVVLAQTCPDTVDLAIIALPDASATIAATQTLKRLAPNLPIIARVHGGDDMARVRQAGANAVVHAEFEASITMIRRALIWLEVEPEIIDAHVRAIWRRRYGISNQTGP